MMKKLIYSLFVCLFISTVSASYTYVIDTYQSLPDLIGMQSMLITGQGGGSYTYLSDSSSITVESTSTPLGQGTGGVWEIKISYNSSLHMSGGQVNIVNIGNAATAALSGGLIQQIRSSQSAWKNINGTPAWNPHITIACLDYLHNPSTNLLTGHWLDGTAFSIHLIDVQGYSPAIQNIQFIPEPATMALFALGGILLRRKK
jgi:hypothetical protein